MDGSPPLYELSALELLLEKLKPHARVTTIAHVPVNDRVFPVYAVSLGTNDPRAPALALVGGVHGLERIGTRIVLAYLETLSVRLAWDRVLRDTLERVRLIFVPLVNPGGMWLGARGNPRGVDLMRNAPRAQGGRGTLLIGGQRLSAKLPWFAGDSQVMEGETRALCDTIERELLCSDVAVAVDCHSGFGLVDRLWFPYARTRKPFPNLAEVVGLKRLLDATLPNHVYRVEPQAHAYTIDGDVWDHLYDLQRTRAPQRVFVPLTLEMGSWAWVRKNPRQLWSREGSFNPVLPHRLKRTLRRHLPLFDLLVHAVRSHDAWVAGDEWTRARWEDEAFSTWPRT